MKLTFLLLALSCFFNICYAKSNDIELCSEVFEYKGEAYFCAEHTELGKELFRSNGTPAGTNIVIDIDVGKSSSTPDSFFELNGYLYFIAENPQYGRALWRTDGTKENTKKIKSLPVTNSYFQNNARVVVRRNREVFFQIKIDDQLWRTDGTSSGTYKLNAEVTDGSFSNPSSWPATTYYLRGDSLFYVTYDSLFKLNLKTNSSSLIKKFSTNFSRVYTTAIYENEDDMNNFYIGHYFGGGEDTGLWQSDGTASGTLKKYDGENVIGKLRDNFLVCENDQLYVLSDNVKTILPNAKIDQYCTAYVDAKFGDKMYLTYFDGGSNDLKVVDFNSKSIVNISKDVEVLSYVESRVTSQNVIITGDDRRKLYSVDGFSSEKKLIKEFSNSKVVSLYLNPAHRDFYFIVRTRSDGSGYANELWWSNGTSESVRKIKRLPGGYSPITWREGHRLYFGVYPDVSDVTQNTLWHSDATAKGTYKLTYFTQDNKVGKGNKGFVVPAIQLLLDEEANQN